MSDCHCIIYHPQDQDGRDRAMAMARSGDAGLAAIGVAMLGPCPSREEESS